MNRLMLAFGIFMLSKGVVMDIINWIAKPDGWIAWACVATTIIAIGSALIAFAFPKKP